MEAERPGVNAHGSRMGAMGVAVKVGVVRGCGNVLIRIVSGPPRAATALSRSLRFTRCLLRLLRLFSIFFFFFWSQATRSEDVVVITKASIAGGNDGASGMSLLTRR